MTKLPSDCSFIEDVHAFYPFPGSKAFQGFEIDECLFEKQSPFQHIAIYSNQALGRVLVLDNIIQITTKDEFIYQEMMAHTPLFSHPNPQNVLIIGGGDGGILREVLRHPGIEKAVMAEIDQDVIDTCVKFMPEINESGAIYQHPKAELVVDDAAEYIKKTDLYFDVVIIDSTDPIGPGEKLFTKTFYENLASKLSEKAFVITQGGVPFFQKEEIGETLKSLSDAGLKTTCCLAPVPTYYGGSMTLGFASNTTENLVPDLSELQSRYRKSGFQTKHYSPEVHQASFVLPPWVEALIQEKRSQKNNEKEAA